MILSCIILNTDLYFYLIENISCLYICVEISCHFLQDISKSRFKILRPITCNDWRASKIHKRNKCYEIFNWHIQTWRKTIEEYLLWYVKREMQCLKYFRYCVNYFFILMLSNTYSWIKAILLNIWNIFQILSSRPKYKNSKIKNWNTQTNVI